MADILSIDRFGSFEVEGHAYRIPADLSPREVFSYRRLMEPIPEVPGGTCLTMEQRRRQRAYLLRRAAACLIPGLEEKSLQSLSLGSLRSLHYWILEHRAQVAEPIPRVSA